MTDGDLRYEQLGPQHLPLQRHFRCATEALDIYLRSKRAWKEQEQNLASVGVLYDSDRNRIAGYYTLSAYYIRRSVLPEEQTVGKPRYIDYPATLLGRLARDVTYARERIGERLLLDALSRSLQASLAVASFAVVVDVKTADLEAFFRRYGFERLETEDERERKYYLPMDTIRQLFM